VADSLIDFLAREYEYLRGREGRDFFLAVARYDDELRRKRRIRKALKRLERETRDAAKHYADEQNGLIEDAKRIRGDLAARAPEIDNTDMARPDEATHAYGHWRYDSFAGFDDLVERDARLQIGYPAVPGDHDDPGVLGDMLQILRGRQRAALYGEDASINAPQIRDDLGDLGQRLGDLTRRREHALTRFRQEARTLPGLALGRLAYFGSDLNPEPPTIETDEDVEKWLDKTLREWGAPKTIVRKLVNAEQMDTWEQYSAAETEAFLKGELDRLHQELTRHSSPGPASSVFAFVRDPWVVTVVGGLIVVALAVYFGLGGTDDPAPPITVTVTTTP
jgi:hypothetical protein